MAVEPNIPRYVVFLRRRCPRCESTKLHRVGNKAALRYYLCKTCGWEFKGETK